MRITRMMHSIGITMRLERSIPRRSTRSRMNAHDIVTSAVFFFNDRATTEVYTLSLHDALPILAELGPLGHVGPEDVPGGHVGAGEMLRQDRKSTRLNSSHLGISYAVFCLK